MTIQFKTGHLQDCDQIANWINSVGHGHIEYLLDSLVPDRFALKYLALVLAEDLNYSYKNVDIAKDGNNMVGLVFSYHSDSNQLTSEIQSVLSEDRIQWMKYFSDNQIDNSWYINTLGVATEFRRQGLARLLLDHASKRALQNGTQCLSLHVYENNIEAIKLYESYGFSKEKKIDLTAHSFFIARNLSANYLMKCDVSRLQI
ncbi:MAG: GNAT family N-acetyltransferase [Gammaproteobacteria bacterium]|nr:GNAT family N-acetyltransferase [Gammaproteobacteria bacterium]NNC66482.1 GNAT family N-acetyltransferase [Gammaproteobacteria bacterium]